MRLTPAAPTRELRDRLAALEKQVQQLDRTVATARPVSPAREITTEPISLEPASAARKQVRIREDQTAFDEIVPRAGMAADSVPPHQLRSAPASVNDVAERLLTSFNASDLAEHAFVTHAGCEASSCAMDVTFNDVRSAIEHEMQLTRWLSEADSSCSFILDPLAIDSIVNIANISRRVSFDCG